MTLLSGRSDGVSIEVDGGVARIVLDRPEKLNALTVRGLGRIAGACALLNERSDLKVVVISGAGGTFTAGMDVTEFAGIMDDADAVRSIGALGSDMCNAIESLEVVTIAAIEGHCIGGGVLIAACCDIRVASDSARFAIAEIEIGLPFTWGGVPRVIREIGPAAARELVLTGRRFNAAEALRTGLVNEVVPAEALPAAVANRVEAITAKSRHSLVANKRALRVAANAIVGVDVAGDDAQLLVEAFRDPESRARAEAYVDEVGGA